MPAIIFSRAIGPVAVDVVLSEAHESRLSITKNPIEAGADVADHAYVEPKRLTLDFAAAGAALTYAALVRFQESRQPFTVVSGLFIYDNMLIEVLTADRDPDTAFILKGRAVLSEAIIVETAYAQSEDTGSQKSGQAGGKKSTNAAKPSSGRSGDAVTADRASGTVARGDATSSASSTAEDQSALYRLKYGSSAARVGRGDL
ncbi:hypothetical protein SAMN02745157_2532 [Kaistia soli DSM 19436]|uniref:Dit-like phage tail protein N-terminal domain-containing protein n=1 Tax=Kaistia soli DSM 19436 TaxID=1122133 RepID=A0A1M5D1H0_9HYPH|nr:hypothetical protein [Kaistia soli]SHF60858.1 hypothetical protein SAMN02745157_2532 [Kaistia soli DSM 19436]